MDRPNADRRDRAERRGDLDHHGEERLAGLLKERLYVTIVGLSILLAIGQHGEHLVVGEVAAALTIGVVASVLAAVLADVIAHLSAHRVLPQGAEARHLVASASWALLVLPLPLLLLGLARLGVLEAETAVAAGAWTLVASLAAVAYRAIRASGLSRLAQAAVLVATLAFGALVVALQILAHG